MNSDTNFKKILYLIMVLIAFGGCSSGYILKETVTKSSEIPNITINGHKLHSEVFGSPEKQVVIFLHGGPGLDYRNALVFKEFADEYRVVFFDQMGCGLSERVKENEYSLESSLSELNGIIDYYSKYKKAILIGHSWGAMLATGYISKYPEKVEKAVLMEPGALNAVMLEEFIKKSQRMSFGTFFHMIRTKMVSIFYGDTDAQKDYFSYEWIYGYKGDDNPYLDYYKDRKIPHEVKIHWRFGGAASERIPQSVFKDGKIVFDLTTGLDKFNNKVLFITSDSNKVIGLKTQEKHIKLFKNGEMVTIKDSGHYMFIDKPKETIEAVRKYLKDE